MIVEDAMTKEMRPGFKSAEDMDPRVDLRRLKESKPRPETSQEILAAHFEECARILRKHPELFGAQALEHVGIVAGLSTRVVRLAARGLGLVQIMRDVGGPFVAGLYNVSKTNRVAMGLLAGARRGFVQAANRSLARELLKNQSRVVRVSPPTGYALKGGRPHVISSCPRCGTMARRDLQAPAPCSTCGFAFAPV